MRNSYYSVILCVVGRSQINCARCSDFALMILGLDIENQKNILLEADEGLLYLTNIAIIPK